MLANPYDLLGILAGTLTTVSFVPQVLRIVQTRSANDISWGMFSVFAFGTALWLAWGIAQGAMPVIIANLVTLLMAVVIMILKWRYGSLERSRQ
jgi:MtN3 and saliva related transmembrane protein